ncbi:galectin-1 [Lacerta agilis]|uniref:galectin-1 n=1 Tax=Lacerta agilis TaxID=80427 RepID=UPI001419DDB5|nr:galectin-1 [Lacerta agilis]
MRAAFSIHKEGCATSPTNSCRHPLLHPSSAAAFGLANGACDSSAASLYKGKGVALLSATTLSKHPSELQEQTAWKHSIMPGITCTSLHVAPGGKLAVKGDIPAGAKSFAINVGKGPNEIILHFNPRFDAHGDIRTIVCNNKINGKWGQEHREANFPFQEGSSAEVLFTHDKNELTVTLPGNHQFKVPNGAHLEGIEYVCVEGDFNFKGISLS